MGNKHDAEKPLWLHLPYQAVHGPYTDTPEWEQVPYNPRFCGGRPEKDCKTFGDMLHVLDSGIGNVTQALKSKGLWDETLMLFTSDNGGIGPGNNYPLRGHKMTPWEGGTRVAAFLSGGIVPKNLRGKSSGTFVHVADWYATFASLVGVSPRDTARTKHDIDGINVWPFLTGGNSTSTREFLPITEDSIIWKSQYKLMTVAKATNDYTTNDTTVPSKLACTVAHPCLFDLLEDPGETRNIAGQHPSIVKRLTKQLNAYEIYTSASMSDTELADYTC